MKYTIQKNALDVNWVVRDNEDGTITWIPTDPANSDYQAYLKSFENAE